MTCREDSNHSFDWPDGRLIGRFDQCVTILVDHERKSGQWHRSEWENIKILDKRIPSLRLVERINNLVKRAIEKREKLCGESLLEKAARDADSAQTQALLMDFRMNGGKFAKAVKDHESHLWHRWQSRPLFWWVCQIEHPDAKQLVLPHIESPEETEPTDYSKERESRKRWNTLKRQRRFRKRKKL